MSLHDKIKPGSYPAPYLLSLPFTLLATSTPLQFIHAHLTSALQTYHIQKAVGFHPNTGPSRAGPSPEA